MGPEVSQLPSQLPVNSAFSKEVPKLQIAFDSTSIGALQRCPRFYQLSIIEGWRGKEPAIDLQFGIWLHSGRERFYHAKADGAQYEEAHNAALEYVLTESWDQSLGRPWMGDEYKNRFTLVRTLSWYLEEWKDDPLETVTLANGKPAVEVSFRFELGALASSGEMYMLCGHLDRLVRLSEKLFVSDLKSTKSALGSWYYAQFENDNQMSTYSFAAGVVLSEPCEGVIIDAAQIGVGFSRFGRHVLKRHPARLEEWYRSLKVLLAQNEQYVAQDFWPQNPSSCFKYGRPCEFLSICSRPPQSREQWLKADFVKRVWDPLQVRGDV